MKKIVISFAALIAATGLTACGDSAAEQTAKNNEALCKSLTALQSDVDSVSASAAETTAGGEQISVGDAKKSLQTVGNGIGKVLESSADLKSSVGEQFQEAQQQYLDALQDISDNTPLSEASEQVSAAQDNLQAQYKEILAEVGCN